MLLLYVPHSLAIFVVQLCKCYSCAEWRLLLVPLQLHLTPMHDNSNHDNINFIAWGYVRIGVKRT